MRTRRGDSIDVAPLLLQIFDVIDSKLADGEKPGLPVWSTLIDKLSRAAQSDSSLWPYINRAIRTMFDAYPAYSPSMNLLRIGLEASASTTDAGLASEIMRREVEKLGLPSSAGTVKPVGDILPNETDSWGENESIIADQLEKPGSNNHKGQHDMGPAPIPHQAFRKSLEISLLSSDTKSAASILESFNLIRVAYPVAAQADLYALALLCHARAGDAGNAKNILLTMMKGDMQPR
jgi:hypothetical protein